MSPVAFHARSRVLGILKHPSFTTEPVLAKVLTHILNEGEMSQALPTTEWSVEPLGDVSEFYGWLKKVDELHVLRTVFKRPNPDAEESFQELFDRLEALHADQIRQELRASDKSAGLNKKAIESDEQTQGFLTAALQFAFGHVWAKGRKRGKVVRYDQRRQVLRASVEDVGGTWDDAAETVLRAVERRGTKQIAKMNHGPTSD
ncbi:hypothetical protein AB3M83_01785 [Microbacterium sp. 179-B 1A2 NHS]|uniref:hypothetical protein n=1 Tax=Microbacterium sp. 179-B 1A2 NHS TaxID=3142383 RepID=UPI0039A265C9